MKKAILLSLILVLGLDAKIAKADFTFGIPINLGPIVNSPAYDERPSISADGLTLYFNSNKAGGYGDFDLWMTTRSTKDSPWGQPENLGSTVNTSAREQTPWISADGLSLYFNSTRPGGYGPALWGDIWITKRATTSDPWDVPVNLGPIVNTPSHVYGPCISYDGLSIFFGSDLVGGYGGDDIWVMTRATTDDGWGSPTNLGPTVNSSAHEGAPSISSDGLTLFFSGYALGPYRPGGYGNADIWMTTRPSISDPWGKPINLGPKVNTSSYDFFPSISADGYTIFFMSDRSGGYGNWDMWQVSIEPVVDLNSDGFVDGEDLRIIGDNWGTDNSLCDIGPMPWGDGIVDVKDLIVIAEYLQPAAPEDLNVDEQDDGGQVELKVGQILVVTLESNPTTGYSWQQAENQEPFLEQQGQPDFISSQTGGPPMVGVGGWEVFRFKAVKPGKMNLKLIYRRPWEEGVEPVNTFTLDVTIH